MPRYDGTGPMGMGPMSGRAAGACINNKNKPNNANDLNNPNNAYSSGRGQTAINGDMGEMSPAMVCGRGRGMRGMGRGFSGMGQGRGGRGQRHMFYATGLTGQQRTRGLVGQLDVTDDMRLAAFEARKASLEAELEAINTALQNDTAHNSVHKTTESE